MASTEEKAYEIMRELDVSYVLVIFGGLTGYSSDGNEIDIFLATRLRKLDEISYFSILLLILPTYFLSWYIYATWGLVILIFVSNK